VGVYAQPSLKKKRQTRVARTKLEKQNEEGKINAYMLDPGTNMSARLHLQDLFLFLFLPILVPQKGYFWTDQCGRIEGKTHTSQIP